MERLRTCGAAGDWEWASSLTWLGSTARWCANAGQRPLKPCSPLAEIAARDPEVGQRSTEPECSLRIVVHSPGQRGPQIVVVVC